MERASLYGSIGTMHKRCLMYSSTKSRIGNLLIVARRMDHSFFWTIAGGIRESRRAIGTLSGVRGLCMDLVRSLASQHIGTLSQRRLEFEYGCDNEDGL